MLNIQYRSNLISVINEVESLNLSEEHHVYLQQTPFWNLFSCILNHTIVKEYTKKSDVELERIIQTFDRQSKSFNIGGIQLRIHENELRLMFGIQDGNQLIDSAKRTNRPTTDFVSRRFEGLVRIKKQNISEALRQAAEDQTDIARKDVARLLTLFCLATLFVPNKGHSLSWYYVGLVQNLDRLQQYNWSQHILEFLENNLCLASKNTSIAGCVMMLPYWICEHTKLVEQVLPTGTPRFLVWDLKPLSDAMKKINLKKLHRNQVIQYEPETNHDDDDAEVSETSIMGTETAEMIMDDLVISDILKQLKTNVPRLKHTAHYESGTAAEGTPEDDKSGIDPETVPDHTGGSTPTTIPEIPEEASQSVPVQQPTDTIASVIASLNDERIQDLEQQLKGRNEKIAELENQLKQKDEALRIKDEALSKFYIDTEHLNLKNAKMKEDLDNANAIVEMLKGELEDTEDIIEGKVHKVTQQAKSSISNQQQTATATEPPSRIKRLKEKTRQKKRDPQYTYSGKKRAAKKQKLNDTPAVPIYTESDVIDVELLQQLSKLESDMPKQPSLKQIISVFQQNAHLSASEKDRILKLIDSEGQV